MTRGAMKARIAQRLNLVSGEPGSVASDPFAIDNAINRVVDTFAGPGMDCYWTETTAPLVSGTREYALPAMYKLTGAYWLDSAGNWAPLRPTSPQYMDRNWSNWRNDTGSSYCEWIVFEGANRGFVLYPYFNGTATAGQTAGGLKFEGYANAIVSGIASWSADTAECPLPSWCHDGIWLGAAMDIAQTMVASDLPAEIAKAQRILGMQGPGSLAHDYRKARGAAESAAATHHQDTVRANMSPYWSAWGG